MFTFFPQNWHSGSSSSIKDQRRVVGSIVGSSEFSYLVSIKVHNRNSFFLTSPFLHRHSGGGDRDALDYSHFPSTARYGRDVSQPGLISSWSDLLAVPGLDIPGRIFCIDSNYSSIPVCSCKVSGIHPPSQSGWRGPNHCPAPRYVLSVTREYSNCASELS